MKRVWAVVVIVAIPGTPALACASLLAPDSAGAHACCRRVERPVAKDCCRMMPPVPSVVKVVTPPPAAAHLPPASQAALFVLPLPQPHTATLFAAPGAATPAFLRHQSLRL